MRYKDTAGTFKVIIKQERIDSEAGEQKIILTSNEDEQLRWQNAHTIGEITSIGADAFDHGRMKSGQEFFKVGDTVRFKPFSGHQYRSERDKFGKPEGDYMYLVNDDDVLSKVEALDE